MNAYAIVSLISSRFSLENPMDTVWLQLLFVVPYRIISWRRGFSSNTSTTLPVQSGEPTNTRTWVPCISFITAFKPWLTCRRVNCSHTWCNAITVWSFPTVASIPCKWWYFIPVKYWLICMFANCSPASSTWNQGLQGNGCEGKCPKILHSAEYTEFRQQSYCGGMILNVSAYWRYLFGDFETLRVVGSEFKFHAMSINLVYIVIYIYIK